MPRLPSQIDHDRLIIGARKRILGIVRRYRDGDLTPREFGDRMAFLLEDRHARAAVIGRRRAGQFGPRGPQDNLFGAIVVDKEAEFLQDFVRALEDGRYTDDVSQMVNWRKITRRALMYADKLSGTASEAFGLASNPLATFKWVLGIREKHCEDETLDCPKMATAPPKTAAGMETWPRNCDTPCLNQCGCTVFRSDGRMGFMPMVTK